MAISFDRALGIHEQALGVRIARAQLIANNLANADTPNFKARDIDFLSILRSEDKNHQTPLALTQTQLEHRQHRALDTQFIRGPDAYSLGYRTPHQPSIDGNTVDEHIEHSEFMKNSLAFQVSFTLLNKKFSGLKSAIRGE